MLYTFIYIYNITSAGPVDREIFDIESPPSPHLGTLWANFRLLALLWGALGLPWSRLWPSQAPLACPLAAFGRPLGPLWANFGLLSLLWGALGLPLGCLGSLWGASGQLGRLRGPIASQRLSSTAPAHRIKPPGICPGIPRIPRIQRKWWHEVLLGAPLPHAPGVRMT